MEKPNFETMAHYLPSRKFAAWIFGAAAIVVLFFVVTSHIGTRAIFNKKGVVAVSSGSTIATLVSQDSNHNGISDWEESLWGLDPSGDGAVNKKTIEQKKAAAGVTSDTADTTAVSGTDQFSQSLLSTILALQQSGSLTPEAVSNLASSIGDTVDAKHVVVPTWTRADMTVTAADSVSAKSAYRKALKAAIDKYDSADLGGELEVIANGLGSGDKTTLSKLAPTARGYTALSKDILAIPTPPAAADAALALANQTAIMGASLDQVAHFYDDVLSGMVGLDDYKKASLAADAASAKLSDYFNS